MTAVVTANTGAATDTASVLDGFRPAIAVVTGVAFIGLAVALAGTALGRTHRLEPVVVQVEAEPAPEALPERKAA